MWTPPLDFVSSLNYLKFGWSWSWRLSCHPVSSSHPSSVQYLRRRKSALWVTVALLALALVVLTIGLISATRTDNVPVAGYYPGITVSHTRCRPLRHSTGMCGILLYTLIVFFSPPLSSLCTSSWVLEHFWALLASTWWRTADPWWVCSSAVSFVPVMCTVAILAAADEFILLERNVSHNL